MIYNPLSIFKKTLTGEYFTFHWAAAAAVAVSYLQSQSAKKAAEAQAQAAREAAEKASFKPYNVSGIFGEGAFNRDDGTAQFNPNEFTQGITQQLQDPIAGQLSQEQTAQGALANQASMGFLQQGLQTDPFDVAQSRFSQLEQILNPGRDLQRQALESRLLRQGRLGSTGGTLQQQGLEAGIDQSRQQGLFDIFGDAQKMQQSQIGIGQNLALFGQSQQEVGLGQGLNRLEALRVIDAQGRAMIDQGGVLGGRQSSAGAQAGAFGIQGQSALTAAQLGSAQGYASALNSLGTAADNYNSNKSNTYNSNGSQQSFVAGDQNQPANNYNSGAFSTSNTSQQKG